MTEKMTKTPAMEQIIEALRLSQNSKIGESKSDGVASAVKGLTHALDSAEIDYEFVPYNAVPENAEIVEGFENVPSRKLQEKAILLEDADDKVVFQVGIKSLFVNFPEQDDLMLTAYVLKEKTGLEAVAGAMASLKNSSPVAAETAKAGARLLAVVGALGAVGWEIYKGVPKYYHWSGCYVQGTEGEGPYDPIECRGFPEELVQKTTARTEARSLQQRGMESWNPFWRYDSDLNGAAIPLKDGDGNVIEYRYEGEYVYPPMMGSSNIIPMVFPQNFAEAVEADQITILDLPQREPQIVNDKASNTFETDNGIATANVYFETGVTSLTNADRSDIQNFITLLLDKDIDAVTLYGQTDTVGTTEQNERLAAERIESVRALFESVGISVQVVNRGEVGDSERDDDYARKVEIVAQKTLDLVMQETQPQIVLLDTSVRAMPDDKEDRLLARLARVPQVFQTNTFPALAERELRAWSEHNLNHPFLAPRDGMDGEIVDLLAYVEENLGVYLANNQIDRSLSVDEDGLLLRDVNGDVIRENTVMPRDLVITILGSAQNTGRLDADLLLARVNELKAYGLAVVVNYYVDAPLNEKSADFALAMQRFVEGTGGRFFETQ